VLYGVKTDNIHDDFAAVTVIRLELLGAQFRSDISQKDSTQGAIKRTSLWRSLSHARMVFRLERS